MILINAQDITLARQATRSACWNTTERSKVDTVMIGGHIVKRDGKILRVDRE
ncbi:hypothetical protein JQR86_23080 (plasmid) [Pseudomonas sp. JZ134]